MNIYIYLCRDGLTNESQGEPEGGSYMQAKGGSYMQAKGD
jgi:hypothetical protein